MNIQTKTKTEAQITELKFSEQTPIYNDFAAALGIKQVMKPRGKSTGVSRIMREFHDNSQSMDTFFDGEYPVFANEEDAPKACWIILEDYLG
jgi:hypothetical protein